MRETVLMLIGIEVDCDADGGTIGAREEMAMRVESLLEPGGRVRFVDMLRRGRMTAREEDGQVRYAGSAEYIPCDRKGRCMEGYACEGCAHADLLQRTAAYEDALMGR